MTDIYGLSGSESFSTTVAPGRTVARDPEPAGFDERGVVGDSDQQRHRPEPGRDSRRLRVCLERAYATARLTHFRATRPPAGRALCSPRRSGGSYTISLATTDSSGSVGTAAPQTIVVNDLATTTSLASSANPSVSGQSVTFTATVSVPGSGTNAVPNPTGTVTFYDNGLAIGAGTLSGTATDTATFTTTMLSTSAHPITAAYTSGDASIARAPSQDPSARW